MKIYCIHNPADKLRAENIKTQFASQEGNWQYEIVEAVMNPNQPSVGILRSFKECIRKAKNGWYSEVLILEDDFLPVIPTAFKELVKTCYNYALNDGIILGSVYEGEVKDQYEEDELLPFSVVRGKIAGLGCVIIPENLYDTILYAEEGYHLDYWLSMVAKIPIYTMWPFSVIQGNFPSANGNNMEELNRNLHLKYKLAGR